MDSIRQDLTRNLLAIIFICSLAGLSLWIVKPFLPAILWATMIVVSTWPLLLALQLKLRNRRWLAVTAMTAVLVLIFVVPFTLAIGTLVNNAEQIAEFGKTVTSLQIPNDPPQWLTRMPWAGEFAISHWRSHVVENEAGIARKLAPYISKGITWFIGEIGNFGLLTVQFLLTVIIAAILYLHGELGATFVRRFARRLAGDGGENAVILAGQAIHGVALGVVVTALVQTGLAGLGLLVAGIPFVAILTAVMFMLAIAQLGPFLVLLPSVAWLYWIGDATWATALLVWTLFVGTIDNVLRPFLIKKGADLPLLLIFTGVVGGMISLGLVGIFVGPVVLAVSFTLLCAWITETDSRL